jgi:threonine dehydrogenase-like Zn-dependent dehydrogenase
VNYPVILGHEFAGLVAKLGNRVTAFKEGDRVASETTALLPSDSALIRQGLYNLEPSRLGFIQRQNRSQSNTQPDFAPLRMARGL